MNKYHVYIVLAKYPTESIIHIPNVRVEVSAMWEKSLRYSQENIEIHLAY